MDDIDRSKGIDKLAGIKPDEVKKLEDVNVRTITELWDRIGKNPEMGIDQLAEASQIEPYRLIELLSTQAVLEAEKGRSSWLKQPWALLARLSLWQRHVFDVLVLGLLVVLIILIASVLYAQGVF